MLKNFTVKIYTVTSQRYLKTLALVVSFKSHLTCYLCETLKVNKQLFLLISVKMSKFNTYRVILTFCEVCNFIKITAYKN